MCWWPSDEAWLPPRTTIVSPEKSCWRPLDKSVISTGGGAGDEFGAHHLHVPDVGGGLEHHDAEVVDDHIGVVGSLLELRNASEGVDEVQPLGKGLGSHQREDLVLPRPARLGHVDHGLVGKSDEVP